jgi:hypothetical protein
MGLVFAADGRHRPGGRLMPHRPGRRHRRPDNTIMSVHLLLLQQQ